MATVIERLRESLETVKRLRNSACLPDVYEQCRAAEEAERILKVHAYNILALAEVAKRIDSDMQENKDNTVCDTDKADLRSALADLEKEAT